MLNPPPPLFDQIYVNRKLWSNHNFYFLGLSGKARKIPSSAGPERPEKLRLAQVMAITMFKFVPIRIFIFMDFHEFFWLLIINFNRDKLSPDYHN